MPKSMSRPLTLYIAASTAAKRTYFLLQGLGSYQEPTGDWSEIDPIVLHQYPLGTPTAHGAIPSDVREAAVEAEKCLAVGAPNACGVMARRAMHALCQDKGAKGKDLYGQLEWLRDQSV